MEDFTAYCGIVAEDIVEIGSFLLKPVRDMHRKERHSLFNPSYYRLSDRIKSMTVIREDENERVLQIFPLFAEKCRQIVIANRYLKWVYKILEAE